MRLLPCGDLALLVELDDLSQVMAVARALSAEPPDGVVDVVPAARTVLLRFEPGSPPQRVRQAARALWPRAVDAAQVAAFAPSPATEADVVIAVRYDGPDLAWTARYAGRSIDDLVRHHTSVIWTVAFCGFSPGFGYLVAADWDVDVSRLATPRAQVPAGAVGLAGRFSGVYPRSSPGGWRLLGHTTVRVWDSDRDPPALLPPGAQVRFEAVP